MKTYLIQWIGTPSCRRLITASSLLLALFTCTTTASAAVVNVNTAAQLTSAVNNGSAGDTVIVAPGTYLLGASLLPKPNMIIQGAGKGATILQPTSGWNPGTTGLPDNATNHTSAVQSAYLFNLASNNGIKVSGMTLNGAGRLHGAFYGNDADNGELYQLHIRDFIWSGIRTWRMTQASIHDCDFEDAGGVHGGITGGGLYMTWVADSLIYNNRFFRSVGSTRNFYGIKGRQAVRCRIHHNTILVNFSIEFPHEHDQDNEIDHNYIAGVISLPKNGGGGLLPPSGITFHIHSNYFKSSYAIEGPRNGMEIEYNLFDFSDNPTYGDGGNLISSWGDTAQGPTKFHNNLIKDPGRGIFWSQNVYNNYSFYNNHVIANRTATPRTEGFFGFNSSTAFNTIVIKDNIIECINQPRPLMRNSASHSAVIQNNTLINVSDSGSYANANTGAPRGPLAPLYFNCGVEGEYLVNQWVISEAFWADPTEVIVDNSDSSGVEITGTWPTSTSVGGYHGLNYLHDGNTGKGSKTVRFRPELAAAAYEVFIRYASGSGRASNVPIDITHASGTSTIYLDQRTGGGQWVSLGVFTFSSGNTGNVLIRNAGTSGHVIADAVRFEPQQIVPTEVIVDNSDSSGVEITGTWPTSTSVGGYHGLNYLHDGNTGKGSKTVRFRPELAAAAYEVFIRYTSGSGRASNVPIDIIHANGTEYVEIDQRTGGGQWVSLGVFTFSSGNTGNVLIRNAGTSGHVIVDAVRFAPQQIVTTEVIVDNVNPNAEFIGAWLSSSANGGYHGTNYHHDSNSGKGSKSVRFRPTLQAAPYEVFIRYSSNSNRASNVPVDIIHANGTEYVEIDQRTGGGQWVSLGVFTFSSGNTGNVLIGNTGTSGHVIADAVRFTPTSQ